MSRSSLIFAFVLIALAIGAAFLPAPAVAATAPRAALHAVSDGPDALLSADAGGTRVLPAPRAFAPGVSFSLAIPRPCAPVASPSPVRTGTCVDGLSLPLLR